MNKLQQAYTELKENYDDAMWWRHRIGNRFIGPIHTNIYPRRTGSTYLMDEDWDNLIVLDGCRVDLFEEVVDTDQFDSYKHITSPGSKTPEWAQQNFGNEEHGDIVYISSNGWISEALSGQFHELIEVWRETDGVPYPEDITKAALEAHQKYPDKRLVVHYLQPHRPFITSEVGFQEGFTDNPWKALARGEVTRDQIWDLYRENLEVVIDDAVRMMEVLPGRNIMTSDHGNLLGEDAGWIPFTLYGHPGGVRAPGLVEVPWVVRESSERPEIRESATHSAKTREMDKEIQSHLEDLGYLG